MKEGKVIAFWSNWHGRGNTVHCIASALQFSMLNNKESIITHTQYTRSSMEEALLTGKENDDILKFSDFGLDSLERAFKTGRLKPKDLNDYCTNIIDRKLEFLPGSKKTKKELFEDSVGKTMLDIINFSKKSKDFIFIDVGGTEYHKVNQKVLELADVVFVTVDQSRIVLKDFFEKQIEELDGKKIVLLVGRYDEESNYLIKDIKKEFKYDGDIIGIPYVTDYFDALCSHKTLKLFKKYYTYEGELFIDSLNSISDVILNNMNRRLK